MSWKSARSIRTCLLLYNPCIYISGLWLNLRAFLYVLSCKTLKMFWVLEVWFGNSLHMEVECDIISVKYIVEIGKIMRNVNAC